jgi:hypothetical protein
MGALTGDLRIAAREWLRDELTAAFLRPDLEDLQEFEKVTLTMALMSFDEELELELLRILQQSLSKAGVETWGLPTEYERLIADA